MHTTAHSAFYPMGTKSLVVKWLQCEADYSLPSSAEVMYVCMAIYIQCPISLYHLIVHSTYRDNFALHLTHYTHQMLKYSA